ETLVYELDKCSSDFFHIDCLDEVRVFEDIKTIKKISNTPIDLHIITDKPENFYPYLKETPVEYITFQYENLPPNFSFEGFRQAEIAGKLGLALVSNTAVEAFDEFSEVVDFVLFMTTTPGKSGGTFNKENFAKIRAFQKKYPHKKVHVDGGVNGEISFILRNMGVYSSVSGSFLVANDSIARAMLALRSNRSDSHIELREFMIQRQDTPSILHETANFIEILKNIEQFKIGMTVIVDKEDKMIGIVTNADIRKALLKYNQQVFEIPIDEILNTNPFYLLENETTREMMHKIKRTNFPISYLPVLNADKKLTGCLTFYDLVKGEF
ncbi:MAG: CBS domain-containing protein, partial [Bacteroidia bacterium]